MTSQEYFCPVRKIKLSINHAVGERCYLGLKGNFCNEDSKLCNILEAHELAQNSPSSNLMEAGIETDPSSGNPVPYVRPAKSKQSQPLCTSEVTEDHGPLGKPYYEKKDEPSLRSPVQKRY